MQSVPETDLIYSGRAARALERTCGRVWHAEQDGGTGSRNFRREEVEQVSCIGQIESMDCKRTGLMARHVLYRRSTRRGRGHDSRHVVRRDSR